MAWPSESMTGWSSRARMASTAGLGAKSMARVLSRSGVAPGPILKTRSAFSRRNFGQTSSLNGTFGMSRNWRSSVSPAGK